MEVSKGNIHGKPQEEFAEMQIIILMNAMNNKM